MMRKNLFSENRLISFDKIPVPNIQEGNSKFPKQIPTGGFVVPDLKDIKTPQVVRKNPQIDEKYRKFLEANKIPREKQLAAIDMLKLSLTSIKTLGTIIKRAKELIKADLEDTGHEAGGETKLSAYLSVVNFKDKFKLFTGALAYIDKSSQGFVEGGAAIKMDIEGVQLTYMRQANNTNSYILNFDATDGLSTQIKFDHSGSNYNANIWTNYTFTEQFSAGAAMNVAGNMKRPNTMNLSLEGTAFGNYKLPIKSIGRDLNFGLEMTYGTNVGKRTMQCIFKIGMSSS